MEVVLAAELPFEGFRRLERARAGREGAFSLLCYTRSVLWRSRLQLYSLSASMIFTPNPKESLDKE